MVGDEKLVRGALMSTIDLHAIIPIDTFNKIVDLYNMSVRYTRQEWLSMCQVCHGSENCFLKAWSVARPLS